MSDRPLVTAVIPAYNCEAFLGDAIESVQAQTYSPIQILVIDDGSTDGTGEVARNHEGVEYHWKANGGVSSARNFAMPFVRGDFVAFLDGDDVWLPKKTELQIAMMLARPELALVYTGLYVTDERLNVLYRIDPAPGSTALRKTLLLEKPFMTGIGSSGMIPRRVIEQHPSPFDVRFRSSQDWAFACALALEHPVESVPQPMFLYRQRGSGQVHHNQAQIEHDTRLFVSELSPEHLAAHRISLNRLKANLHLSLGIGYARRGHWTAAARHLAEGIARRPDRLAAAVRARLREKRQR